jgi:hypothetical protein
MPRNVNPSSTAFGQSTSLASDGASASTDPGRTRVIEEGGHRWTVAEAEFPTSANPLGRCLLFTSDAVIRRVRTYPADWYERTDAALYQVSQSS